MGEWIKINKHSRESGNFIKGLRFFLLLKIF
nr:MAG TPA: hypothetical protein [Caudoviricetes sp.]